MMLNAKKRRCHINKNMSAKEAQFEGEAKFEMLLETASVAIVIVDERGQIELINGKVEELFGYAREELIGQMLEVLLPERFRQGHLHHRANFMSHPRVRSMGAEMDLAARRKDGSEFPVEIGLSYINTSNGLLTVGFITDITERRRSQDALQHYARQEARWRAQLEKHAHNLEKRVTERTQEIERRRKVAEGLGEILTVLNSNRPLSEILDYIVALAGRLLGTDATALFQLAEKEGPLTIVAARGLSADYVAHVQIPLGFGIVGQVAQERRPMAINDISAVLRQQQPEEVAAILRELAKSYHSLLAVPLLVKEEVYGCIVLYYSDWHLFSEEDVGLAVAFGDQAALAIENARLRAQVQQNAVAAERNRLARDLHDAVTQTLFSASLIAEVLPRLWERQPEEGPRRLEELRQLTRGALAEMRTLLFELRPAVLVKTDLRELLRQLTEAITGRARLPVSLTIEGTPFPLLPDVQVAFYRIAQEALNNVAKHSGASQASVTLRFLQEAQENSLILSVYDNGSGFILANVAPQRLGLNIMQERAEAISATLMIDTEPDYGTEVMVSWSQKSNKKENQK